MYVKGSETLVKDLIEIKWVQEEAKLLTKLDTSGVIKEEQKEVLDEDGQDVRRKKSTSGSKKNVLWASDIISKPLWL